jgi:hypothetical protein
MIKVPDSCTRVLLQHLCARGAVFLCHSAAHAKQKRVLERVGDVFRQHGHIVKHYPFISP